MEKPSLKERFLYWLDNRLSKGSLAMLKGLVGITLFFIFFIVILLILTGSAGSYEAFWNTVATVINAWSPFAGDGNPTYMMLLCIAAIAGLFLTSVLTGIFTTAIQDRIMSLRNGNSPVLEKGHIIVLGFVPGRYSLLRELVLAEGNNSCVIVVADNRERTEMESLISENIEHPKNIRITCRRIDTFDPNALLRCGVTEAKSIIINRENDDDTVKALLAVSSVVESRKCPDVRVCAVISRKDFKFPESIAKAHNIRTLVSGDIAASIISHSCTSPGISSMFQDIFDFSGSEFYMKDFPGSIHKTFSEVSAEVDSGIPVGICHEGLMFLCPEENTPIEEGDLLLVFAHDETAVSYSSEEAPPVEFSESETRLENAPSGKVLFLGYNKNFISILRELPENVHDITAAGMPENIEENLNHLSQVRKGLRIAISEKNYQSRDSLLSLIRDVSHVVILSDEKLSDEKADMNSIFTILSLRDLRSEYDLTFNITAEMRQESNQRLMVTDDGTDFFVASNMTSLFLAQLAENPGGSMVLRELLSNVGSELSLKSAESLHLTGSHPVWELRRKALHERYIFLGLLKKEEKRFLSSPMLFRNQCLTLSPDDQIIVIGES